MDKISAQQYEHFKEKAILAESKITEKIRKSFEDIETAGRRWFWELLQNAKDCASYNPEFPEIIYRNEKDKRINVTLKYFEKDGEHFLSFEHDGNPFSYSNDPFRFDDVTNLILPVSGKDDEFKTGKFGTGFLSTHILSLKVRVEGVFVGKDFQPKDFDLIIDRTKFASAHSSSELRKEFIESIIDAQRKSLDYKEHAGKIFSRFTYYLDCNLKGDIRWAKDLVEEGLDDLNTLLPYVLCFNSSLESVTVINDIQGITARYSLVDNNITPFDSEFFLEKTVLKNDQRVNILLADRNDIQLAMLFAEGGDPGSRNFINLEDDYKGVTKKRPPFIFSSFPLIGSEDFVFPVIINSSKFSPKESRDSVFLKTNESGNQAIIEEAAELYKILLSKLSSGRWQKIFNIANTIASYKPDHKWIADDWYRSVITSIRSCLLTETLVDVPTNEKQGVFVRKAIKSADGSCLYFPITVNKEKLWKFSVMLYPEKVPCLEELTNWNKILWDNERDIRKINGVFLIREIAKYRDDVHQLGIKMFSDDNNSLDRIIAWLLEFAQFIQNDLKDVSLFDFKEPGFEFPILPSRSGKLKLASELSYDRGFYSDETIEDKTLELFAEFCGTSIADNVLHKCFSILSILPFARETKEIDLATKICEIVRNKIKEQNLSVADKSILSNLRNYLYEIKSEKLIESELDKKRRREKYAKLYDLDLERIFLAVVEKEKISSVTKLLESDRTGKINIEEIAEHPDLGRIFQLGKNLLEEEKREDANFQFKKTIGVYIENLVRQKIQNLVSDFSVVVKEKQNGQDMLIMLGDKVIYYIEVKSRWKKDSSVIMSNAQIKKATQNRKIYSLCEVDMSTYDLEDRYEVEDINRIIDRIRFVTNIGHKIAPLIENAISVEADINAVKLTDDYRAIIPQLLIKDTGEFLDPFVVYLIRTLKLDELTELQPALS